MEITRTVPRILFERPGVQRSQSCELTFRGGAWLNKVVKTTPKILFDKPNREVEDRGGSESVRLNRSCEGRRRAASLAGKVSGIGQGREKWRAQWRAATPAEGGARNTLQQFSRENKRQRWEPSDDLGEIFLVPVSSSCYRQARYWPGVLRYPLPNLDLAAETRIMPRQRGQQRPGSLSKIICALDGRSRIPKLFGLAWRRDFVLHASPSCLLSAQARSWRDCSLWSVVVCFLKRSPLESSCVLLRSLQVGPFPALPSSDDSTISNHDQSPSLHPMYLLIPLPTSRRTFPWRAGDKT